jgi:uncharacterized membrane protein YfcA
VSPRWRRRIALILLVASLIGWPLSAFTFARGEPQFILGLSWLAITLTCADIASTTDVRVEVDEGAEGTEGGGRSE